MNLALPGLALAHELYLALRAQGKGARAPRRSCSLWPGSRT